MSELQTLFERLKKATVYTDIFPDVATTKDVYRKIARVIHPDRHTGADYGVATYAFQLLNTFKDEADQMAADGRFGEPVVMATIRTKRARHEVRRGLGEGDITKLYETVTTVDGGFYNNAVGLLKVAKSPRDNDLVAAEALALKKIHANTDFHTGEPKFSRAIPVLLDTFIYSEGRRRANVLIQLQDGYTMEEILYSFPDGVDPRHGVWMFRRLLMALGFAHEQGVIHGAVVPAHVFILPKDHGVILLDWCYSVDMPVCDSESKTTSILWTGVPKPAPMAKVPAIKAMVPGWEKLYPAEVRDKKPASTATDLYMAAATMLQMMPRAPRPLRAFFKGCMQTKQSMRPDDAWKLLREFDDLLKGMGEPFYPRRFVEFSVPAGTE